MHLSDFDFDLPPELIAQHPAPTRDASRMLVLNQVDGACTFHPFSVFPSCLRPDDCLVLNNTKVIPARLLGCRADTGGNVEALLLEQLGPLTWHCLMKPGRRLRPGETIKIRHTDNASFEIRAKRQDGTFEILLHSQASEDFLQAHGTIPLPPYISHQTTADDWQRYQTVYAAEPGAVAAPTAGLHFTPEILEQVRQKGVPVVTVTLHVGPGTFRPVQVERIEEHTMHEERFLLPADTAATVNATRARGGRVIAVGTTSVRVLETCLDSTTGQVAAQKGRTRLFMHPPMKPRVCNGLLTNFHLPRSTLLMLVATFSTVEDVLNAYKAAIEKRMRFYSYGDCMLVV
ncbi:MAG: tRNA preQ1(34) S-adenosylmethionine ribosyltransferase-isomerase QueA [Candidatus Pacebacteria bacterium]|nr:tRNA preQ1(34) S-adenosylmethionine ribosyltransferase-isomerase QueA [Candidatus Paceibacterota bacterium]